MPRASRFDIRQAGQQVLLVLGVVAALNFGAYAFFVRPAVVEYRTLKDDTRPAFDRLNARTSEVESREAFLAALKQATVDLATLREDVLSTRGKRQVEVQAELAKLTREFGIDLNSVEFENEILREQELERFGMVVPLEGGYKNLRRFLQAVETSDKFFIVEQVALARGKEGGVLLQLNITLATYFNLTEEQRRMTRGDRGA